MLERDDGAFAQLSFGWTLPANAAAGLQAGLRLVGTEGLIEIAETVSGMLAAVRVNDAILRALREGGGVDGVRETARSASCR